MQGNQFTVQKVDNGFIVRGQSLDEVRTGIEASETRVARSGSETKAELTYIFNNFLERLDLT